ncbi:hypothetical protein [uncultured Desulfuromonas sp.]|uniref:hypothetical protein n=1 Tax=uncultured Desulfuromonas sp. TaxID=181013 RepID=UPI002AABBEBD|nr:hypothetical protein [uncultured Desulfuromonas sp.]
MPTTIALTFIAFGAAEREGLAAQWQLCRKGGHRPTRFIGTTKKIEHGISLLSTFYAKADALHDSPT